MSTALLKFPLCVLKWTSECSMPKASFIVSRELEVDKKVRQKKHADHEKERKEEKRTAIK